jgi:hypothetical protein
MLWKAEYMYPKNVVNYTIKLARMEMTSNPRLCILAECDD